MTPKCCGVTTFPRADPATLLWHKRHLTWCLTGLVEGVDPQRQRVLTQAVFAAVSAACGLTFAETDAASNPDIRMGSGTLDGRGNVLAWSEVATGDDRPLRQMYELNEGWSGALVAAELRPGEVPLFICRLHEVGHALGVLHSTDPNDVMYPYLSTANWQPTGWFLAELQSRYGPPPVPVLPTLGRFVELTRWYDATRMGKVLVDVGEVYQLEDRTGFANYPGARIHLRSSTTEPPFSVRESYESLKQLLTPS